MTYVSIDIETTGLNPLKDQILQFGAVKSTGEMFTRDIKWARISGDPFALDMNKNLLNCVNGISIRNLHSQFKEWLGNPTDTILAAGKNIAGFDYPFLAQVGFEVMFKHGFLDPGPLYFQSGDIKIPNLTECLKRAGMVPTNLHTALGDAWDVHRLIQFKLTNERLPKHEKDDDVQAQIINEDIRQFNEENNQV